MLHGLCLTGLAAIAVAAPAIAQDTRITADRPRFEIPMNGDVLSITRTGPACPPACIQPMQAASSIATIGELEVLEFLEAFVSAGRGLVVDVRTPSGYAAQTMPGAVNVPASTLRADNPYRDDLLSALGVSSGDFSNAYALVIFASAADDPDAPQALRSLLDAGYPPEKLKYFRGGMQSWTGLGLSTTLGN